MERAKLLDDGHGETDDGLQAEGAQGRGREEGEKGCAEVGLAVDPAHGDAGADVEALEVCELCEDGGELGAAGEPLGLAAVACVGAEGADVLGDVRALDEQRVEALAEDVDAGAGGLWVPLVRRAVGGDVDAGKDVPATWMQERPGGARTGLEGLDVACFMEDVDDGVDDVLRQEDARRHSEVSGGAQDVKT